MKQKETLQLIRTRCVELLEQAKLRTPGAWRKSQFGPISTASGNIRYVAQVVPHGKGNEFNEEDEANATYIANASVAFEAALESTVAAINDCLNVDQSLTPQVQDITTSMMIQVNGSMVDRIITAWKHLLP